MSAHSFRENLYHFQDKLIPEEEFLTILKSRRWQEAPDLLALDKDGSLFIFELKAWESRSENILEVLRYAQIFGSLPYAEQYWRRQGLDNRLWVYQVYGNSGNAMWVGMSVILAQDNPCIESRASRASSLGVVRSEAALSGAVPEPVKGEALEGSGGVAKSGRLRAPQPLG